MRSVIPAFNFICGNGSPLNVFLFVRTPQYRFFICLYLTEINLSGFFTELVRFHIIGFDRLRHHSVLDQGCRLSNRLFLNKSSTIYSAKQIFALNVDLSNYFIRTQTKLPFEHSSYFVTHHKRVNELNIQNLCIKHT